MTVAAYNNLMERWLDAPLGIEPGSDLEDHLEDLFDDFDWLEDEVDGYIERCLAQHAA